MFAKPLRTSNFGDREKFRSEENKSPIKRPHQPKERNFKIKFLNYDRESEVHKLKFKLWISWQRVARYVIQVKIVSVAYGWYIDDISNRYYQWNWLETDSKSTKNLNILRLESKLNETCQAVLENSLELESKKSVVRAIQVKTNHNSNKLVSALKLWLISYGNQRD